MLVGTWLKNSYTDGCAATRPSHGAALSARRAFLRDSGAGAGRRHGGALNAVPLQRCGDETSGLHLLDEPAQPGLRLGAALGNTHRLLDHHEAPREQAHGKSKPSFFMAAFLLSLDFDFGRLDQVHPEFAILRQEARELLR